MPLDFDPRDPAVVADPYPSLAALREADGLVWSEALGMWLAARYVDVNAVLRARGLGRIFRPREPGDVWDTFNWLHADSILDSEPPKHTRLRALVAKAFARGHIERLRPRVRDLCDQLLTAAAQRSAEEGSFDVIADYAEPLPVLVIAELLGVPDADVPLLRPWSQAIVRMYEYERTAEQEAQARLACDEFAEYVSALARDRAAHPGDDLVTHLAQVEAEGEKLTESELVATCVLLLNAGHEASVNGFGNGMVQLFRHPEQLQRVVDDPWGIAATAVEEMLRFDSPLHLFERTATVDVEVNGVQIAAGQKVAALLGAANRDPEAFVDADTFDVARDPNPHVAFGAGIHFCLGAPLARLETTISLPLLVERFPSLHLAGEPVQRPTFVLRGWESVPVSP